MKNQFLGPGSPTPGAQRGWRQVSLCTARRAGAALLLSHPPGPLTSAALRPPVLCLLYPALPGPDPPCAQPEVHTGPPSTAAKQGPFLWLGALGPTSQLQHRASGVASHTSALVKAAPRPLLTRSWQGEGPDEPGEQVASQRPTVFSKPESLGMSCCTEKVSCVSTSRPPFLGEKSRLS